MGPAQVCETCGATVQPEHVDQGRAGRLAGKLLCSACYAQKKAGDKEPIATVLPPKPNPQPPDGGGDEPISLVGPSSGPAPSRIQTFGHTAIAPLKKAFKRQPAANGQGACRLRTFHSKLAAESIEFMDSAINEWLDENPGIEVKFVTTSIGVMAGKHPEPNLILNVWY